MTQTKSALPVTYQRGSTIESTTLYKGGLFSFLVKGMELPTEAILHGRGVANDDEFIDPGDSIRVGAANGIHFLSSGENTDELPHYPGFKFKQDLVGDMDRQLSTAGV